MHAIDMREAAKLLDTGPQTLCKFLRARGILHSDGRLKNTPLASYIRQGLFTCELVQYRTGPVVHLHNKPMITGPGLAFIRELMDQNGLAKNNSVVPAEQHRASGEQTINHYRSEVLRLAGIETDDHPAPGRVSHSGRS